MDTNQLISHEIDELLGNSTVTDPNDLEKVEQELLELEDRQKAEILQIETYTMMAKYQIMFLKFEDKLQKLRRIITRKQTGHKLDFFAVLRRRSTVCSETKRILAVKFAERIGDLLTVSGTKARLRLLVGAFQNIKTRAAVLSGFGKEDEKIGRLIQGIKRYESMRSTFGKRKPSSVVKKSLAASKIVVEEGYTNDTEVKDRSFGPATSKKSQSKNISEMLLKKKRQETSHLKQRVSALLSSVDGFVTHIDQMLDSLIKPEQ